MSGPVAAAVSCGTAHMHRHGQVWLVCLSECCKQQLSGCKAHLTDFPPSWCTSECYNQSASGCEVYLPGFPCLAAIQHAVIGWQLCKAFWCGICRYARFVNPVEYQQAFTAAGERLCICCLAAVTACTAQKTAVLDGAMDLFCG